MSESKKIKVIELFAGIGAWHSALENLGIDHEVVLAVEQDEYPLTAYNAIHNTNFEPIDITELDENTVPDCDVVCWSPPCQSWSQAGKQGGFDDHRGVLFFDGLKIIKAKQPKYALMENVKGLTQKKFENEFNEMLDELDKAGYNNYWKILNARDYGIPQNRERLFLISIRKDIDQEFEFPESYKNVNNLANFLEDDATLPILHNIYGGFKESKARVFDEYCPTIRTSAGGGHIPSMVVKGCSLRTRNYMRQPQKLEVRKDDVSNTVTTVPKDYMVAIFNNKEIIDLDELLENVNKSDVKGLKLAVKKDNEYRLVKEKGDLASDGEYLFIREMTNKEAFRLMGFADEDYEKARQAMNDRFYKGKDRSRTRLYKCAGNSIVVNVCEAIFKELFKTSLQK